MAAQTSASLGDDETAADRAARLARSGSPLTAEQQLAVEAANKAAAGGTFQTIADSFGAGGLANNLILKDNPVAGTVQSGYDVSQGNYLKAGSDFVSGQSFGVTPQIDANGNIVAGDTTSAIANAAGAPPGIPGVTAPITGPGGVLQNTLGSLGSLLGGPDLTGINKASADAQALEQQFLGQLNGLQPGVAPTMTAAQSAAAGMDAASMNAAAVGAASTGATPTIGPSIMTPAQAAMVAMANASNMTPAQVQAAQTQAAQMTAAPNVQASLMNAATPIQAQQMTAAQLDDAQQAQFRTQQADLASNLSSVIAGNQPSVAELQMRQAFGQQMAQQQGLAAALGRGGNQGLAMRTAMNNMGQLGAQQAAQSALLRAQEQTAARGQLGGVLSEARDTDVNVAAQNAQNQQGAGQFNAGLAQNAEQINAQNQQAAASQNAQQAQQVALQNQQMQQQAALTNAANQQNALSQTSQQLQGANLANATNQQNASQFNANAANNVSATNAAASNAANLQFAGNQQNANLTNAQLAQQAALQNAANTQTVNLSNTQNQQQSLLQTSAQQQAAAAQNAQQAQQAAAINAQNQQQTALANAANTQNANANNQTSALTTTGQDINRQQVVGNQTLQANQNDVSAQVGAVQAQNQTTQQEMNLIATGLGVASKTLSDRRAKKDIEDVSPEDMRAFYQAISPQSWRYKGSAQKRVGPMAQDIESSAVGKTMIRETPAGKAIDIPSATTAMLAAIADMGRRIDQIEGRRAR